MKAHFLLICPLLVLGLSGIQCGPNADNRAVAQTKRTHVIDVRTENEWKAGHIEGAILIPYGQIREGIAEVTTDKSASIAIYCRSGRRAEIARRSLQELGYLNVENLGGLHDARRKLGAP